jgi:hypothetical protein
MTPADDVRLENILAELALLKAERAELRGALSRIEGALQRVERVMATPMLYTRAEACQRLGIAVSTAAHDPRRLPAPVAEKPLRYRVEDVEELASASKKGAAA